MRRAEFVEAMSKFFGMPPFAIETANYRIVICDCGKTHNREMFGKGCPGWTIELKSTKELKKEREGLDYEDHTRRVREWRRKHGYKPTALERGGSAEHQPAAVKKAPVVEQRPVNNVFKTLDKQKGRRHGR